MKNNKNFLATVIICGLLLSACGNENEILLSNKQTEDTVNDMEDLSSVETTFSESIPETYYYVHLCGAIIYPGVYEVTEGMRLYEVIDLAGGFTADACENYINQALQIEDGQKIYIPTESEVEKEDFNDALNDAVSSINNGLVNINTAMAEELCTLPGIGASRAQDIITYREQNGDFSTIEAIQQVTGIKAGLFSKIKNLITV